MMFLENPFPLRLPSIMRSIPDDETVHIQFDGQRDKPFAVRELFNYNVDRPVFECIPKKGRTGPEYITVMGAERVAVVRVGDHVLYNAATKESQLHPDHRPTMAAELAQYLYDNYTGAHDRELYPGIQYTFNFAGGFENKQEWRTLSDGRSLHLQFQDAFALGPEYSRAGLHIIVSRDKDALPMDQFGWDATDVGFTGRVSECRLCIGGTPGKPLSDNYVSVWHDPIRFDDISRTERTEQMFRGRFAFAHQTYHALLTQIYDEIIGGDAPTHHRLPDIDMQAFRRYQATVPVEEQ